jgi:hypothetical protein
MMSRHSKVVYCRHCTDLETGPREKWTGIVHSSREGIESCCSVRLLRGKNVKTSVSVRGRGPTAHGSRDFSMPQSIE